MPPRDNLGTSEGDAAAPVQVGDLNLKGRSRQCGRRGSFARSQTVTCLRARRQTEECRCGAGAGAGLAWISFVMVLHTYIQICVCMYLCTYKRDVSGPSTHARTRTQDVDSLCMYQAALQNDVLHQRISGRADEPCAMMRCYPPVRLSRLSTYLQTTCSSRPQTPCIHTIQYTHYYLHTHLQRHSHRTPSPFHPHPPPSLSPHYVTPGPSLPESRRKRKSFRRPPRVLHARWATRVHITYIR